MFEMAVDLVVDCTPGEAFEHIAVGFFEHHRLWDPSVTSMERTSLGPIGVGTTGIEGRRFGPWSVASSFEVTEFEPDRRFGFRTTTGSMIEEGDWAIAPHESGSAVHVHFRLRPQARPLRLIAPFLTPLFRSSARRNTERLRAALDSLGGRPLGVAVS